ncbi:MAG: GatB/YqeY domain-containing protein [Alphaproteobacteria bacterium]|nr:GatB/YqeY domain-containing protein [Alphaproteobacteria bacterium]
MLRTSINDAMKEAMKARDERRVSTLRMMNAAIKNGDIEQRGQGKEPLNEAELMSLFQKMIKQRQESAELYEKGGRGELAAQEKAEIEIISSYLPKQMSDVEAGAAISALLQEINAQTMKDMGRAMAALRERFAGKMDFGKASAKIKELLSGK